MTELLHGLIKLFRSALRVKVQTLALCRLSLYLCAYFVF
jgi:hypothetical protein